MLPELAWSCSDLAQILVANDGDTARVQEFDEQALDKTRTIKTGDPKGVRVLITETKSSSCTSRAHALPMRSSVQQRLLSIVPSGA